MSQYTAHLDWHFRVKRREKDNARKAQSRKWYIEKRDWIVSDEIEDENEEMTEEELDAEEEIVIPTVAVEADKKENSTCPVCREDFDTFYKQGEAEDEGSWYLHNAMRTEEGLFHPECHKDKDNAMDVTLADTSLEEPVPEIKEESTPAAEGESKNETELELSVENCIIKEESPVPPLVEPDVTMEDVEKESSLPEKSQDNDDNGVESEKAEDVIKPEDTEAEAEVEEASKSLVDDGVDGGDNSLTAPVVPQAKVNINIKINSSAPLERRESLMSVPSENEEGSEFDKEAVVVEGPTQEEIDLAKPRMKGKKFTAFPAMNKDNELSGLCSIM